MLVSIIGLFIIGLIFGSFYNCLADRLCNNESIIKPGSHCDNCKHVLSWYELIPVFSFIFLKGKCRKCKCKLSLFYPTIELLTGILFALSIWKFGYSIETLISLILVSIIIITFVSDFKYYIILDEVLLIGGVSILICIYFVSGLEGLCHALLGGAFISLLMVLIKTCGDKVFKTESLGWGDIKLSIIAGFILGIRLSTVYLFLSSLIALPFGIIFSYKTKAKIIPFGPFLSISLLTIYWLSTNFYTLLSLILGGAL